MSDLEKTLRDLGGRPLTDRQIATAARLRRILDERGGEAIVDSVLALQILQLEDLEKLPGDLKGAAAALSRALADLPKAAVAAAEKDIAGRVDRQVDGAAARAVDKLSDKVVAVADRIADQRNSVLVNRWRSIAFAAAALGTIAIAGVAGVAGYGLGRHENAAALANYEIAKSSPFGQRVLELAMVNVGADPCAVLAPDNVSAGVYATKEGIRVCRILAFVDPQSPGTSIGTLQSTLNQVAMAAAGGAWWILILVGLVLGTCLTWIGSKITNRKKGI